MTTFLTNEGYLALVIFAFVQACCIPISSEITFGFAGVLAYEHHLSLPLVIIIGTLAELAGSFTAYGVGRKAGRSAVERYRRYVLMTRKDVERAERFFSGRGAWAIAVARIIPLVRAFAGLVAGLVEVPAAPFAIFNLIGTAVWVTALSLAGYALGSDWDKASKNFSHASDALGGLVILALLVAILHKWLQLRKERKSDAAQADAEATAGLSTSGPGTGGPGTGGPGTGGSGIAGPGGAGPGSAAPAAGGPRHAATAHTAAAAEDTARAPGSHRAPTDRQGG
jgi:membrane protein DedA with SNARE-associated domain